MTTIPPTHNRDYYRCLETSELIEAVRYAIPGRVNWEELAHALAERLRMNERDHECPQCGY